MADTPHIMFPSNVMMMENERINTAFPRTGFDGIHWAGGAQEVWGGVHSFFACLFYSHDRWLRVPVEMEHRSYSK